jgi:hypothetical protein
MYCEEHPVLLITSTTEGDAFVENVRGSGTNGEMLSMVFDFRVADVTCREWYVNH